MLILLAHGSRDPEWRASLENLAGQVRAQLPGEPVEIAFMQFEGPLLPEVVKKAMESGHRDFRLLPLFMASAGHVDKDIRPLVSLLAEAHPEADLTIMTPVGEHHLFPRFIVDLTTGPHKPE